MNQAGDAPMVGAPRRWDFLAGMMQELGFKSFVDPADLVIESGLTGVVGPNGCGKSNLLEALRWTMGENSAKSLRGAGMEAEVVPLASDTMSMLARLQPDLVLMDLHMPEMDGMTAIAEIRRGAAGENMRQVWIAALTADARDDQREKVLAEGANDYLTKPIKPLELGAAFQRFIASLPEE
jgi:CheY-like chemotaxis protein